MARGKKTPPEVIYQIMASWAVTDNFEETAKKLKIPVNTVRDIVRNNKNKPEFVELRALKKEEFVNDMDEIIRLAVSRLKGELENKEKPIPVNYLMSVIGTSYDKRALAKGEATENTKNTIEIILPEGCEEYAE